jgi:hypothetical protein
MKKTLIVMLALQWQMALADEGMWLLNLIAQNMGSMQALGLKLTAEDIYSVNNSSLKDAIVRFDDGSCTGELVSPKGLFLTNHHCGVEAVQFHSTPERNLLRDGFWAQRLTEELAIPGKTASILVSIEDVSQRVLAQVDDNLPSPEYFNQLYDAMRTLEAEASQKGKYYAEVKPMFNHNAFYLFLYERYLDVRLVGVPPSSMGNFGGDVDNWHWPRHTADFCLFRIYTAPDGSPAEYSPRNVPYKPKRYLTISLNGVKENDYAMIIGYPGTTHRYATSYEALHNRDVVAPWKENVWGEFIRTIKEAQRNDPKVKVDYTDKHDMLVNFYQKDTWQAQSMYRFGVVENRRSREDSLKRWASADPANRGKYIESLPVLESYFSQFRQNQWEEATSSINALTYLPVDVVKNINACENLFMAMLENRQPKGFLGFLRKDKVKKEAKLLEKQIPNIFKNYHKNPDVFLYSTALGSLLRHTGDCPNIPMIQAMKRQPNIDQLYPLYAQNFFDRSYFTSPENLRKFLRTPVVDSLVKDPVFMLTQSLSILSDSLANRIRPLQADYERAMQRFTRGLMEMEQTTMHYPDANSTMRLTYGKVLGYKPADGMWYKAFTYLDGVMEKENPEMEIFHVDPKLKRLWELKDYGRYGENGAMPVCFLTDNDITGGNSGSPVLNGEGKLIGIAFDGNAEAMACDFEFEPDMQRTIIVDIRYVLFLIDKYAGAKNLIDEMAIQ